MSWQVALCTGYTAILDGFVDKNTYTHVIKIINDKKYLFDGTHYTASIKDLCGQGHRLCKPF